MVIAENILLIFRRCVEVIAQPFGRLVARDASKIRQEPTEELRRRPISRGRIGSDAQAQERDAQDAFNRGKYLCQPQVGLHQAIGIDVNAIAGEELVVCAS